MPSLFFVFFVSFARFVAKKAGLNGYGISRPRR
jgi:hypothetical protein